MRILFLGTPAFAVLSLEQLISSSHHVLGVITQPDKPKGRGRKPALPPVKQVAQTAGIPVLQPVRIKDSLETIRELEPECLVVVAYGQILPGQLLSLPKYGGINVHASLLPKYRGAAPINWAIINGDSHTGISIMQMDAGLDSGAVLAQAAIPIEPQDTAGSLHNKLAQLGAGLLVDTLSQLEQGRIIPQPQAEANVSYAPMLTKADGLIDWTLDAIVIERRIRGLNPWPGAYTYLEGKRVKLLGAKVADLPIGKLPQSGQIIEASAKGINVAAGGGVLALHKLQPENRAVMQVSQYLAGQRESLVDRIFSSKP